MKDEKNILRDVIETAPPEEESKTRKYIRITIASVGMALILFLVVMAILRR
jgi:hypothetical protein